MYSNKQLCISVAYPTREETTELLDKVLCAEMALGEDYWYSFYWVACHWSIEVGKSGTVFKNVVKGTIVRKTKID